MPPRLARRARTLQALGLLVAGAATTSEARASGACDASPLVSACVNAETLWPHAGPQIFATVGGVETVESGRFAFGLVTDYQSRPIVFHVPGPGADGTDQYAIDNQVNGNFLWAYGVTRRLELDFALPITFGQDGSGAAPITGGNVALHATALRDARFGLAYQLVAHDDGASAQSAARSTPVADATHGFGLTARFEISVPSGDHDQFAGDATVVAVPSLAADYRSGRWFAGFELGARLRPDAQVQGANVGPQATIALGLGYDLLEKAKLLGLMVEARSLPTFATQYALTTTATGTTEVSSGSVLAPSEWMIALRSSPLATDDFSVTLGGGSELTSGDAGFTAPRFRFLLGLRYAPTPMPAVVHAARGRTIPMLNLASKPDLCKDDPDTADGFKDTDGCPDEDADKDGIDDRYDRCPLVPEDFAGLTDGCPDKTPPSGTPTSPAAPTSSSPPSPSPPPH